MTGQRGSSPSDERRPPSDPAAEGRKQQQITALQPPRPNRLIHGNRDRGRRSISITVDVHKDPLPREIQPLGDGIDDFSLSCIGEGNGNPLQCSCLENPRDGGAWWLPSMGSHRSEERRVGKECRSRWSPY